VKPALLFGRIPAAIWPVLAAVAALAPVLGAFSTTRVFHVRDLTMYFWPRHLWLRETVLNGDWPWWDPYAGAGQSAVADALNHFFLLPVTLVRLALPDVAGFNFWVAAPFPVAAVGAWFWLRRYGSPAGAFVGAAIFALSGPVVSTGNFPNLSWAVACLPWVLWSTDRVVERPGVRPVALLAVLMALQAVAGEPVTLAGTAVLAMAYAAFGSQATDWRPRAARVLRVAGGLGTGALLSSVQMVPLGWAAMHSPRGVNSYAASWSFHPMEVADLVVPHLFGHSHSGMASTMPWLTAFHGREPLFVTVYLGLGALALAAVSPRDAGTRRRRAFWWAVAIVALVCAFGRYTPVYPALQAALPVLQSFRYPTKYLVFFVAALAALAAAGADGLLAHARSRAAIRRPVLPLAVVGTVTGLAGIVAAVSVVDPALMRRLWEAVAATLPVASPARAAEWMLASSPLPLAAVTALGAGVALLIAVVWSGHRGAPLAAAGCCALAILDPLAVNRDAHPTMLAAALGPPQWVSVARQHPADRVYVGGRLLAPVQPPRFHPATVDAAREFSADAELPFTEGNSRLGAEFVYFPAAWHLRESISYDLPQLWPSEYATMIQMFGRAPREDRLRFARRTGVRYCFLPEPPDARAAPLTPPNPSSGMALYECGTAPRRVYVTSAARIEPVVTNQLALMFDAAHDPQVQVLLEREAPPAEGRPGTPAAPEARVRGERNTELIVDASVGEEGGYLNVLDSFDTAWRVAVDGQPGTLLRANGVYRAVRLTPGRHEVRFSYRPMAFYAGLAVTVLAAVVLLIACGREWLTAREAARRMRQAVTAP
jgi:hypothetical protein